MVTHRLIDLMTPTGNNYDFKYISDDVEKTLFTNNQFYIFVRAKYNHMLIDTETEDIADAKSEALAIFQLWRETNKYNYGRFFDALEKDYNPIENYFREELGEEQTEKHTGTKTKQTIKNTGTETLERHKGSKAVEETDRNGYNSDVAVPSDKVTTTIMDNSSTVFDKDVQTFDNRVTETSVEIEDISPEKFNKDILKFNGRVTRGNIGTTTNAQMLLGEKSIRLQKYIEMIMTDFINTFCYYAGGVE